MAGPRGLRVRNALVVDDSPGARRRIRTLLRLGGWRVHEAAGTSETLRLAAVVDLDVVVTDMALRDGNGPELLWRLRDGGCAARFLVVANDVTPQVRAQAAAAGAAACLAKPVDPQELLDFLLDGTAPDAAQGHDRASHGGPALQVDAERLDRVQDGYRTALPHRIAAIVSSIRDGDVAATGSAARLLAEISEEAGHEGVARICEAIAADAERGVLSRSRGTQLVALGAGAHAGIAALTGQATSSA
jgi:CheY-like chemotaxis protein